MPPAVGSTTYAVDVAHAGIGATVVSVPLCGGASKERWTSLEPPVPDATGAGTKSSPMAPVSAAALEIWCAGSAAALGSSTIADGAPAGTRSSPDVVV